MTGDEAYHAECFRCVQCNTKIEDLVFTQTSKGIFCTKCHETRKQLRQKRKEEKLKYQQRLQEMERTGRLKMPTTDKLMTDIQQKNRASNNNLELQKLKIDTLIPSQQTISLEKVESSSPLQRQLSNNSILNDYVDHISSYQLQPNSPPSPPPKPTELPPSTEELIKLNNMLNAAIEGGLMDDNISYVTPNTTTETSASINTHTEDFMDDKTSVSELKKELEWTKSRLENTETKFNQIKSISRKALDEFSKVKERYSAETKARQEAEMTVNKLQNELSFYHHITIFGDVGFSQYNQDELADLHRLKLQAEKSVNDLRNQRDDIFEDIERKKSLYWEQFTQPQQQYITSLQHDIDHAKLGYGRLVKARDDIIAEMIMLNTKNAELSSMNNDLSRKVTEREREAIAVMAGTSFLPNDLINNATITTTAETDNLKNVTSPKLTAHRDNFNDAVAPRLFKFRRNRSKNNGSNSSGSNNNNSSAHDKKEKESIDTLIGMPYDTNNKEMTEKPANIEGQLRVGNHLFNPTKYLRPTKCDVCNEKMWRSNEFKCQECGIACHTKCVYRAIPCQRKSTSDSTNSDHSQKGTMFGQDLIKQVKIEQNQIPLVVRKCIEAVENRGMDYEGIYRKSGGAGQMKSIQQAFEQNENPNLCDEDQWNDICAVTSVLKQYFRDLPNPLFTYELYKEFVTAILSSEPKDKLETFQKLLRKLPTEHFNTLKFLMQHLSKVDARNEENLMTAKNIAVIFGPTLLRSNDESLDLIEMNHKIGCIEYILNHMTMFDEPIPEINKSAPLPTRKNSLPSRHRREASIPTPVFPPEKAGYI
ncbi:unnamed protein product [Cunninghamella echinulata]